MNGRRLSLAAGLAAACAIFAVSVAPVAGQSKSAVPRDPNGHPDLQGIWSYATVTPLERPDALAGKATFASDDEVAEFEKTTVENRNQDRRDGAGTNADVARGTTTLHALELFGPGVLPVLTAVAYEVGRAT